MSALARACSTSSRASSGCTASPPRSGPRHGRSCGQRSSSSRATCASTTTRRSRRRPGGRDRAAAVRARRRDRRHAVRRRRGPSRVPRSSRSPISTPRSAGSAAALEVRRGDVVAETVRAAREVGATTVFASADVSPYAVGTRAAARRRARPPARQRQLRRPCGRGHSDGERPLPGLLALPPRLVAGAVRACRSRRRRAIRLPPGVEPGPAPRGPRSTGACAGRRERGRSSEPAPGCATHLDGYGSGGPRRDRGRRDLAALALPALRLRLAPLARRACAGAAAEMPSCASSAGGTSTPRSCLLSPERRSRTCAHAATTGSTTPTGSRPGRRG